MITLFLTFSSRKACSLQCHVLCCGLRYRCNSAHSARVCIVRRCVRHACGLDWGEEKCLRNYDQETCGKIFSIDGGEGGNSNANINTVSLGDAEVECGLWGGRRLAWHPVVCCRAGVGAVLWQYKLI
jgi:hypothetical protein